MSDFQEIGCGSIFKRRLWTYDMSALLTSNLKFRYFWKISETQKQRSNWAIYNRHDWLNAIYVARQVYEKALRSQETLIAKLG